MGVWILVAWFVGPALLIALCCVGALVSGMGRYVIEGPPEPVPTQTTSESGSPD